MGRRACAVRAAQRRNVWRDYTSQSSPFCATFSKHTAYKRGVIQTRGQRSARSTSWVWYSALRLSLSCFDRAAVPHRVQRKYLQFNVHRAGWCRIVEGAWLPAVGKPRPHRLSAILGDSSMLDAPGCLRYLAEISFSLGAWLKRRSKKNEILECRAPPLWRRLLVGSRVPCLPGFRPTSHA